MKTGVIARSGEAVQINAVQTYLLSDMIITVAQTKLESVPFVISASSHCIKIQFYPFLSIAKHRQHIKSKPLDEYLIYTFCGDRIVSHFIFCRSQKVVASYSNDRKRPLR